MLLAFFFVWANLNIWQKDIHISFTQKIAMSSDEQRFIIVHNNTVIAKNVTTWQIDNYLMSNVHLWHIWLNIDTHASLMSFEKIIVDANNTLYLREYNKTK